MASAKDEIGGMSQGVRAHYYVATSKKEPKTFNMKEEYDEDDDDDGSQHTHILTKHVLNGLRTKYPDAKFSGEDGEIKSHDGELNMSVATGKVKDHVGTMMWDVKTGKYTGVLGDAIKKTTDHMLKKYPGSKPALFVSGDNQNPDAWNHIAKKHGYKVVEDDDPLHEATYQGKDVPLNKPMAGDVKKSKVYVDPDGDGKAQKVNFGDKTMSIKKDQPGRKKSFLARHNCDDKNDKTKAGYWSCKAWK